MTREMKMRLNLWQIVNQLISYEVECNGDG